jgi:hypothetical protein
LAEKLLRAKSAAEDGIETMYSMRQKNGVYNIVEICLLDFESISTKFSIFLLE